MAYWSAENATKAFLSILKMGQKAKEPAVAEFISALAAGNNAELMVVASAAAADSTTLALIAAAADSTTLALIAAANQTNGNVVCIVPNHEDVTASKNILGVASNQVKFMTENEARELSILNKADFVVIDCNLVNHKEILKLVQIGGGKQKGRVIVGYNAFSYKGSWKSNGSKTKLLPIGEGLFVIRYRGNAIGPKFESGKSKNARVDCEG